MNDLFLIYINRIGENHKGEFLYEFIFSETTKNVDGEHWDAYPAAGRPTPPNIAFISSVGVLNTDIVFELIQDNSILAVWDAVDGVISLAYEDINDYDKYPEKRLFFFFGDTKEDVENKLYEKDLILNYNKLANDKHK